MNPSEIPVGLKKGNRVNGDDHRLVGSAETDSVLQGIRSLGDYGFFCAGGNETMERLGKTLGSDRLD